MEASITRRPSWLSGFKPALGYAVFIAGLGAFILAVSPIIYPDSDVWIHLSGGKYFMEHGRPPHDSYFSFITPPRPWNSYAWLFQAVAYALYQWWGAGGLLFLRSALYAAAMYAVIRLLLRGQEGSRGVRWLALAAVLCALVLLPRAMHIRPHMFTYAFIPLALYILEVRPQRAAWLPVLGLVWCNVHGVTYPVMLLIAGAYSLEYLVHRAAGRPQAPAVNRTTFVCLVLMMATVFLTPQGPKLFEAPFRPSAYLSAFVNEMSPMRWSQLATFEVERWVPKARTFFNVAWVAVLLSAAWAVSRKRLRVSHAVLVLGAAALLFRGQRFTNEFLLLSLPLLRAHPLPLLDQADAGLPRPVRWAAWGLVLSLPLTFAALFFETRRQYPVSTTGLPEGVSVFLERLPARGKILNWVSTGGYLRWRLYPKYTIYMDMDSYFDDDDFYRAAHAFTDAHILGPLLREHDPSFLSVPMGAYVKSFRQIAKQFPDYETVFFDDAEVLYINRRHYPELARQYRLHTLDPYEIVAQDVDVTLADANRHEPLLEELGRLLAIYPKGGNANSLAGLILNRRGAHQQALERAEIIVTHFPELLQGYALKAEALRGLGRFDEAVAAYRQAIPRAKEDWRAELVKQMGLIRLEQGNPKAAYRLLAQSVDMFAPHTGLEDLYAYGSAALGAGKTVQARAIFSYMAQFRIPEDDAAWRAKVADALRRLGGERL